MRIFGSDRMDGMLQKLGLKEGEAIVHSWINKALEKAQQKVEARNFDIRKNILKFDNVLNDQRKVIFDQRIELMRMENVEEMVTDMRHQVVDEHVAKHVPANAYPEQWDVAGLKQAVAEAFNLDLPIQDWAKEEGIADEELKARIIKAVDDKAAERTERFGAPIMRQVEKALLLQTLDHLWREHIVTLEHLRQVVGLRGYAQRDPLNEYKSEGFELFNGMIRRLREAVTAQLMRVEIMMQPPPEPTLPEMEAVHADPVTGLNEFDDSRPPATFGNMASATATVGGAMGIEELTVPERDPQNPATWGKVGRNEACPCGSGKKYKHCHGAYT